jgi:hypothetical protein
MKNGDLRKQSAQISITDLPSSSGASVDGSEQVSRAGSYVQDIFRDVAMSCKFGRFTLNLLA